MTEPEKPEPRKLTTAEEKAQVRRDNAFRDLAVIMNKLQGPVLAIVAIDALQPSNTGHATPIKIAVHATPGNVSEIIGQLMQKEKQLAIVLQVITTLILEKNLISLEEFMNASAAAAEATEKMLTRSLLSQGLPPQSIIQKPS
jgi:hypothetical protein